MPIRKGEDFSFESVGRGDLVKQVEIAHGHQQCTAASCSCRTTKFVKVFSKGPWPGLPNGHSNGEAKSLWGVWGTTPEEAEKQWVIAEETDKLKPCSLGGCLSFCTIGLYDNYYFEVLTTYDRVMLVLEDL